MEIKAADVAKLRQMTGAGMMDCKKALVEANGDYERAKEIIREKGKLVAAKRADRETSEGEYKMLSEPVSKNTAPAISMAVKFIKDIKTFSTESPIVLVVPSDHIIQDREIWLHSRCRG